jgi:hypothetical protein
MLFVKIETSDNDRRWINLHQVSRVTIGTDETGVEVLIAVFADGDLNDSLKIHGTDAINKRAIVELERQLNHHSE